MYIIKVILQGIGETLMFRFKEKVSAESVRDDLESNIFASDTAIKSQYILVEDDFGLSVRVPNYTILVVQLIDFEKAMTGDATWQFYQQKFGNRALDKLKAGSPIISPDELRGTFPNGGRRM